VKPYLDDGDVRLYLGDCVEVMAGMEAESVDAVCTDPPYNLEFMGRSWDRGLPDPAAWSECLRVLRPGGHLLAFGGTRTFHRLTCAIEDAGFEVRDCLSWLYGSGFPKSLDVSKAIDRAAGAKREVVGLTTYPGRETRSGVDGAAPGPTYELGMERAHLQHRITAPATPEAADWQGWGTALKPAWEPIILARKPLVGTVAGNVLAHGTGALNVDGCRVGTGETLSRRNSERPNAQTYSGGTWRTGEFGTGDNAGGRWPANVALSHTPDCREVGTRKVRSASPPVPQPDFTQVNARATRLDAHVRIDAMSAGYADPDGTETVAAWECSPDCPVRMLDEEVGERSSASSRSRPPHRATSWHKDDDLGLRACEYAGDTGGPSRFFYTAKASSAERDGASHPTVKPLALMRWLVRLVTPPGGLVLDPFAGSGTTGLACRQEGFRAVLIEREEEYAQMAAHRLRQLSLLSESWGEEG